MQIIIAIDPGASGAIAWCKTGDSTAHVVPMPETRRDTIDALKQIAEQKENGDNIVCYHEKINPFIPDGGASQMFAFGANVERCGCIIETLGIRLIEIAPKKWQGELGLGKSNRIRGPKKGEATNDEIKAAKSVNAREKTAWKNKLKAEAQRRFPDLRVTLKTCDALLILDVARKLQPNPCVLPPAAPAGREQRVVGHSESKGGEH